ncbi:MAG: hypothetical protein QOH46_4259 [Solirubrobacteraceae bacterium]|jgi:hypothetical protein|nr:hypothetical protein [Solirubrobacteraceae bacterium]
MRTLAALLLALAGIAVAALPAPALAGSWSAPRVATSAGTASPPSAAADDRGRLAMGWVRTIGGLRRAEVRHGTVRGFLRSRAIVLDRSTGNVDTVAVAFTPDGVLAAAWRRFLDAAQRVQGATVSTGGSTSGPFELTPDGRESAYQPAFVAGAGGSPLVTWTRRTTAAARPVHGSAFGAPIALPVPGIAATPSIVVDRDGTTVVAWTEGGRVLAAQAPAGGAFGNAARISAAGFARAPQLTVTGDGDVAAAWLSNAGQGNAVHVAVRPRGGAFGPSSQVVEPGQNAFAPRLAAIAAGEVLLAWINTRAANGFAGGRGVVRLQRLGAAARPLSGPVQLSPDGVRASAPALAPDGAGGALVAWTDFRAGLGTVQARRIVPGGILGPVRTLSRRATGITTPQLAGSNGRAVAAWLAGGDVRYSVYR